MTRRLASLIAPCLAAAAAVGLSACGGGSSGTSLEGKSARDVLKATFGSSQAIKSGRLNVGVKFDPVGLQGLNGPVTAQISGPFQSAGKGKFPLFDVNAAVNVAGQQLGAGAVSTGSKGYLRLAGQPFDIGDAAYKKLLSTYASAPKDSKSGTVSLGSLGIDPLNWLSSPQKVGEARVGGANTVHVKASVNVPGLLRDASKLLGNAGQLGRVAGRGVPTSISPAQQQQIANGVKSTSFDLWSGKDDGTLRKLDLGVTFQVDPRARASVGGLSSGSLTLDLTIADLNKHQTIATPANARPITELAQALGSLSGIAGLGGQGAGGTGSSGTSGGAGATGGGSAATGQSGGGSQYDRCVQQAGGDLAKVAQCQKLVGQ